MPTIHEDDDPSGEFPILEGWDDGEEAEYAALLAENDRHVALCPEAYC